MRAVQLAAAVVACAALVGCGAATPTLEQGTPASTTTEGTSLVLYVSNQSFDDDPVGITIEIDGKVVVQDQFFVEGQHNWLDYTVPLSAGRHSLHATSSTGATVDEGFELTADATRWAVLDYWYYPGDMPRSFTFSVHDEPVGFA